MGGKEKKSPWVDGLAMGTLEPNASSELSSKISCEKAKNSNLPNFMA